MSALVGSVSLLLVAVLFQIQPLLTRIGLIPADAPPVAVVAAAGLLLLAIPLLMLSRHSGRIPLSLYALLAMPLLHLPVAFFTVPLDALGGGARLAMQMAALAGICAVVDVTRWSDAAVDRTLAGLDWICVFVAAAVIHSYISPSAYETIGEVQAGDVVRRAFGITGDQVGWIMAFVGIVAFATRRWIVLTLTLLALLATGQVGATVMFVAGCLGVYLGRGGIARVLKAASIGAVAVIVAVSMAASIPLLQRLAQGRLTDEGGSGALRLYAMSIGVEMFLESPIVGSGYGTYVYRAAELQPEAFVERRNYVSNTTNQPLQFLYEFGLAFSGVVILIAASAIRKLGRLATRAPDADRERIRGVFWATVAMIVCNQSAVYFLPSALFSLMLAYVSLGFVVHRKAAPQLEILPVLQASK
jgi:hypothetical protein